MFGTILLDVVLPIFVLIGFGCIMQYYFRLDLYTLAKINFYYITPAVVFTGLYNSEISLMLMGEVSLFYALYIAILYVISTTVARSLKYSPGMRGAFTNSVMLDNSGNYGLPINQLVFKGDPLAISVQALIMTFQSFVTFTYGTFVVQNGKANTRKILINFLKMPVPYALALGLLLNLLHSPLPNLLAEPLNYISQSMVAVALLTLGAQIVQYPFRLRRTAVYISMVLRLIAGPMVGFMLVLLLGLKGIPAQALLIASGMPTGVNTSILAEEYKNEPDFAAQTVLLSTIVNVITMTLLISVSRHLV
ncbi:MULTISPECIES: AEC family transporter [Paenibacillus]|uniref:AEC family transporter n=1 Tax=Paenibacillus polymyxa TaxID=1406 RepID=A0AAP3ZY58_PAEPO|nr:MULTISPECIES: AEC family transporter [Paenibacillus]ALA42513.1 permease [Paenibacillus peoriae]APB75750.1 AEC family transporter [Paenibacillus polymyxa]MDH2331720.1 AEC family transporter [Paenibacillus polymyxa]ODB59884.1 permease [Paenibacillus polymyxa]OMF81086.1 permease [Paenibacillus peoriae]